MFFCFSIYSQNEAELYSRVKIDLTNHAIQEVAILGLECDHGIIRPGKFLINDFSAKEIALLQEHGIPFEIVIDDVVRFYQEQHSHSHNHDLHDRDDHCTEGDSGFNYATPQNYQAGSMAGYFTYQEMLDELDKMHELYPSLISEKFTIEGITTHEDRPIHWLRLSDNPSIEEDEPKALYTALHHAREPNSLSQMIFYLWYMLENYETNDEVKYLVDHTEMYFMPCVNPDGYVFNETSNPNGGGLWRKNRRVGADGEVHGVDLNRNYGYQWAYDDIGSSPDSSSAVYRGPSAFSEPETQAVKQLCESYNFQVCLNYHTFGNLLIYPWGYSDQVTNDHASFSAFSDLMTKENKYFAGTGSETVGYTVNGVSDDWMFGEELTKNKIYSLTPEVGDGNFGFWPPESEIDRLNKSALKQNLLAAHILLNYAEAQEQNSGDYIFDLQGVLDFDVFKFGLLEGNVSVEATAISPGLTVAISNNSWDLNHLQEESFIVNYDIDASTVDGSKIEFVLGINMGDYIAYDTISKVYLSNGLTTFFEETMDDESLWNFSNEWAFTQSTFFSEDHSLTDSPDGPYPSNYNAIVQLEDPIYIEEGGAAFLNFYAKWNIETTYDYAQVLISTDGNSFTPVCGKYTVNGSVFQDFDMPLYEGIQEDWVLEQIDLDDYMGQEIYIQFKMSSDGLVDEDGIYIDDISVQSTGNPSSINPDDFKTQTIKINPNPFDENFQLELSGLKHSEINLEIFSNTGKLILKENKLMIDQENYTKQINAESWVSGSYQLVLNDLNGKRILSTKIIKQ